MNLFPIAFAAPWALAGLLALPVLWWLLRVTPPRPKQVIFPPLRLLLGLKLEDETPSKTPWWLIALRMFLAACLIFALAGPVFRPQAVIANASGPLWIVIDNGWSSAPDWAVRQATARAAIAEAANADRPVLVVASADAASQDLSLTTPDTAETRLAALSPRSWSPDREALTAGLEKAAAENPPGEIFWIAEPVENKTVAGDSTNAFAGKLASIAPGATLSIAGETVPAPVMLTGLSQDGEALVAHLRRLDGASVGVARLRSLDRQGIALDERDVDFSGEALTTEARIDLPQELRNEIARIEISGVDTAGAVQLLDDRWRRRSVGLLAAAPGDRAQPLLSPGYFLQKALAPYADIRAPRSPEIAKAIDGFINDGVAAIVLADVGTLGSETERALDDFMQKGGVLIRFAGPRLAASDDPLVPVPLRLGGRTLGGALSWEEPQNLAAFSGNGPFAGLAVPDDVTVERQVLAEPGPDLESHTWATLGDGTPLVTGAARGGGYLVLFHVTADTTWSNLPISGSFVEMLRRGVALGHGGASIKASGEGETLLPPLTILDGFGRVTTPGPDVKPLALSGVADKRTSLETPAGLYGTDDGFRAVNLLRNNDDLVRTDTSGFAGAQRVGLAGNSGTELAPSLFAIAFLVLLVDAIIMMILTGTITVASRWTGRAAAVLLAVGLLAGHVDQVKAQALSPEDEKIMAAVTATRIAYVTTGNAEIDEESAAGLSTLGKFLASRTALEPGEPAAIDPATDELAVYPLIYWPVDPNGPAPSREAIEKIDAFMRNGGTVLFDTRDQLQSIPGSTGAPASPAALKLREMLAGLDIPPLEQVPMDHVLTKSFYLMNDFPGRYVGSPLWVEASQQNPDSPEQPGRPVRGGDGVSPILITGNDMAGAWAADDTGNFLYPVVPGDARQREMAFRSGVNIMMYVLTGNYKADQVHVPALLERLGQ